MCLSEEKEKPEFSACKPERVLSQNQIGCCCHLELVLPNLRDKSLLFKAMIICILTWTELTAGSFLSAFNLMLQGTPTSKMAPEPFPAGPKESIAEYIYSFPLRQSIPCVLLAGTQSHEHTQFKENWRTQSFFLSSQCLHYKFYSYGKEQWLVGNNLPCFLPLANMVVWIRSAPMDSQLRKLVLLDSD